MSGERTGLQAKDVTLSPAEKRKRWIFRKFILNGIYRTAVEADKTGLKAAVEYSTKTGRGVTVNITHLTSSDPQRIMLIMGSQAGLANARVVGPIALHQVWDHPHLIELSKSMGVELYGVVTKKTVEEAKIRGIKGHFIAGQGMRECFKRGAEILPQGGIFVYAPQGTRQAQLLPFKDDPMLSFANAMLKNGAGDFGMISAALGIPGRTNYKNLDGENRLLHYSVRFGPFDTFKSLMERVGPEGLSQFVWNQLTALSPPSYRSPRSFDFAR